MSSDFLFELGTEELPPKSLRSLSESLTASVEQSLTDNKIEFKELNAFCSPRRLAFLIKDCSETTPLTENKLWGPPAKIAFDENGNATKAALGFCQRNGIDASALAVESDGKVEKVCCLKQEGGEAVAELLPGFITIALAQLPIAKRMRWGASRTEFVRPVHWLVLLQNDSIIDAELLGLKTGRTTRGHRFHRNDVIELATATEYETTLQNDGKVVADFGKRRAIIFKQVQDEASALKGTAVIDEDLLDEVTALVEWPVAVSGSFEERFLNVPAQALISSMKEHQKYFHIVDSENNLMPAFITVSNIEADDYSAIKSGNEKVIRPRLADAAFFFETDKKQSLCERREKLKSVVFQSKLGTIFDKTERIKNISNFVAEQLVNSTNTLEIDRSDLDQCAELCKSDLVSNMVYEFPELQGIAGHHYALNDGLSEAVAAGIEEHYQPKFAGDKIPASDVGAIVGLADRIDTLVGIFGIGQIPTGSKDPFALRRASVSSLRIIIEKGYDLDLEALLSFASTQHKTLNENDIAQALNYVLERLNAWYEDKAIATEVVQAVTSKELTNPVDIDLRIHAVAAFYKTDAATSLASANKRVANILAKTDQHSFSAVDASLFEQPEEKSLFDALGLIKEKVVNAVASQDYKTALELLSGLRGDVDAFFDKVMVMADDEAVRQNRLSLLFELRELFLGIADIRYLAVSK